MKRVYCLDIDDGIYKLGDLNMMLYNTDTLTYPAPDPMDPSKPFFTGKIRLSVEVDGETRPFLLYLPQRYPISGAGFFLYPDNGMTCEAFLESENWKALSEELNIALIILEPRAAGWSREDIQSEISYSEAVFKKAISRVYFSLNEATYYIMGLGAGAYVATAHGLLSSTIFSCILADGDYQLAPELLEQLGQIRSDRDITQSKLDVTMPAWLVSRTEQTSDAVLESLKKASHTEDRGLKTQYADVFQQNIRLIHSSLDELPISEIWHTKAQDAIQIPEDVLHRQMVEFGLRFKRWLAIGNGCFRAARTYQDMGLRRFEAEVDGLKREWYVYEPSAYRKDPSQKLPALLAIHGYSCTGPMFAENCEWHMVGERRDFFVIYVSAYPSNLAFGKKTIPLPTWNSFALKAETDDLNFISIVMEDFKNRYPVDPERVYVSGHSNGSLFTQTIMAEMPLPFAAYAPQGAQMHIDLSGDNPAEIDARTIPNDGIIRPVWLMMGEEDLGCADRIEPGNANDRFLELMCRINGVDRSDEQYLENGKYRTYTYATKDGIPLVKFSGIKDAPHTYTQEFAQIYWDQFLCHFRRKADGSIEYTL